MGGDRHGPKSTWAEIDGPRSTWAEIDMGGDRHGPRSMGREFNRSIYYGCTNSPNLSFFFVQKHTYI